jgi:hypothetical protein
MSTVTSDQGRVHAASVSPELGSRTVGRAIAKPLSSDALVHIGSRAATRAVKLAAKGADAQDVLQ